MYIRTKKMNFVKDFEAFKVMSVCCRLFVLHLWYYIRIEKKMYMNLVYSTHKH